MDIKKKKSAFDFKPVDFGPGSKKSSLEIDEVLYGNITKKTKKH
ncbi:MAG TPA: hypothetical protein VJH24_00635 [Candidatus Bilamarchaeaceae archaeon]|nr:hypothetical protein [Candidatus Bilamarchaeaceae archaeon]